LDPPSTQRIDATHGRSSAVTACGSAHPPAAKDAVTVTGAKTKEVAGPIHAENYAFQKDFNVRVLVDGAGLRASPFYSVVQNGLKTPCYRDTLAAAQRIAFGNVVGQKTAVMAGEFANEEEAKKAFTCIGGTDEKTVDDSTGAIYLRRGTIVLALSPEALEGLNVESSSTLHVDTSTFVAARYGDVPGDATPVVGSGTLTIDDRGMRLIVDAEAAQSELIPVIKAKFDQAMTEPLPDVPSVRALGERLRAGATLKTEGARVHGELNLPGDRAATAKFGKDVEATFLEGVAKYIGAAKQAEAKNALGQMARDVVMSSERELLDPKHPNKTFRRKTACIGSQSRTPAAVPKGEKYQSTSKDWATPFWQDLRFEMGMPQYYAYSAVASKDGQTCTLIAEGDLDGDGKTSRFEIVITRDAKRDALVISPVIRETDPDE
jgi:hypothetical protein